MLLIIQVVLAFLITTRGFSSHFRLIFPFMPWLFAGFGFQLQSMFSPCIHTGTTSTLTSIQDDRIQFSIYDVNYLDLPSLPLLLFCTFQSLVGADAPSKSQQVCVFHFSAFNSFQENTHQNTIKLGEIQSSE